MIEVIDKTARRKPDNEAGLMFWLLGAVATLVAYYLMFTGRTVPNPLGLNILGNALFWGAVIGGIAALGWYFSAKGKIQAAREAHAVHLHQAQADQYAETQRRIAEMKAREAAQ